MLVNKIFRGGIERKQLCGYVVVCVCAGLGGAQGKYHLCVWSVLRVFHFYFVDSSRSRQPRL